MPFPRSRWLTPDRGSRRRNAVNQLVAVAAVFGVGAGGWGLWLETEDHFDRAASRDRIAKACAGLVDPDQVLDLNGGTTRARAGSGDDDSIRDLGTASTSAQCQIYRLGKSGSTHGHFLLSVWANPSDDFAQLVSGWDDPFGLLGGPAKDDITREAEQTAAYPIGDGRLGVYYGNAAVVKADCVDESGRTTSVNTMTVAKYFEVAPVTDADRRTLAGLARTAAVRAAKKLGCKATLPALPAELPTPSAKLVNAKSAGGTCGWYAGYIGAKGRWRFPDRALAAPAAHAQEESCLLGVSNKEVRGMWPGLGKDEVGADSLDDVLRVAPFWLRTESSFGDEAREVATDHFGRDQVALKPGTAGYDRDDNVWWASSTCAGQPAVHTLSIDYPYSKVVQKRLQALFKAYVTDVAARRDCTGLRFPAAATFQPS
ncbi:hypothetical protein [Streptomyces sp. MBT62]|uniref:hypothetical protein n=1 Tax=Streptomyces sp. MBT62 TaxID=2800410 RepID=UPI00190C36F8|nr:hypothetical protein [Streptomyces sp. MBT62]MBK3567804.1 hypothetical protein [Streptomyces sp. MBT62]